MANETYDSFEGSVLYKVEVTPGLYVVPDTAFGYVTSFNGMGNPSLEADTAIGTHTITALEEGVQDDGVSIDFRPASSAFLALATRSSGRLSSYTILGSDGGLGQLHTGCKVNSVRLNIAAGRRLTASMDFMSLSHKDNAKITAVVPTDDTWNWIELVTNLSEIVAEIDININHNLRRVAVIGNASYAGPVSGQKRPAHVLREGRQDVSMTTRFFSRPSESVIADLLTTIATQTFAFTGLGTGTPVMTVTLTTGKPARKELNLVDQAESGWPVEFLFKTWSYA